MSTITDTLVKKDQCGCQFQGDLAGTPFEADDGRWSPTFFMKLTARGICSANHPTPNFYMPVIPKVVAAQIQNLLGAHPMADWTVGYLNLTWVHQLKD